MASEFIRQDDAPLFPKVLYNRPVTRGGAGRLLVPGGHSGDFSQPTALYQLAMAAGAGECVVALPDVLVKILGGLTGITFVGSSPSGSLAREALGRLLELSEDVDAVMLGVSLSNNSETSILIEALVRELTVPIIAFDEALLIMRSHPADLISRPDNLLIMTMPEVFKLADQVGSKTQVRPGGGLINKLEIIDGVVQHVAATIVVYGTEIIVATPGEPPIVTPVDYHLSRYPAVYYALLGVFWTQNRANRRAGAATAAYLLGKVSQNLSTDARPTISELARIISQELSAGDDF